MIQKRNCILVYSDMNTWIDFCILVSDENFNKDNIEQKRKEMVEWCEKWKHKYQFRSIFVNNAWAVEYKMLLHF